MEGYLPRAAALGVHYHPVQLVCQPWNAKAMKEFLPVRRAMQGGKVERRTVELR